MSEIVKRLNALLENTLCNGRPTKDDRLEPRKTIKEARDEIVRLNAALAMKAPAKPEYKQEFDGG